MFFLVRDLKKLLNNTLIYYKKFLERFFINEFTMQPPNGKITIELIFKLFFKFVVCIHFIQIILRLSSDKCNSSLEFFIVSISANCKHVYIQSILIFLASFVMLCKSIFWYFIKTVYYIFKLFKLYVALIFYLQYIINFYTSWVYRYILYNFTISLLIITLEVFFVKLFRLWFWYFSIESWKYALNKEVEVRLLVDILLYAVNKGQSSCFKFNKKQAYSMYNHVELNTFIKVVSDIVGGRRISIKQIERLKWTKPFDNFIIKKALKYCIKTNPRITKDFIFLNYIAYLFFFGRDIHRNITRFIYKGDYLLLLQKSFHQRFTKFFYKPLMLVFNNLDFFFEVLYLILYDVYSMLFSFYELLSYREII